MQCHIIVYNLQAEVGLPKIGLKKLNTGYDITLNYIFRMTFWCLQSSRKTNAKFLWISALESEKWSNQKDKKACYYVEYVAPYYKLGAI